MVTLDRPARDRLFEIVSAVPSARDDSLVGVLVEADFESNTARLRTTGGQRIAISFETELADRIQEGLRRQSEFRGEVSYDPKTLEARSVNLQSIVRGDQLVMGLDAGDFWGPGAASRASGQQRRDCSSDAADQRSSFHQQEPRKPSAAGCDNLDTRNREVYEPGNRRADHRDNERDRTGKR